MFKQISILLVGIILLGCNASPRNTENSVDSPAQENRFAWQTYSATDGLFTIDYPQTWSVEAPMAFSSAPVIVWQFRGESISRDLVQSVTLGQHMTPTIAPDVALETWIMQYENQEFEFERLQAQSTTVNGLDAYTVHDRVTPPERDVYVTYIRCRNHVWFLQTMDSNMSSDTLETIYNHMLASLNLLCNNEY